jgi:1-pyrroline-5-carboxylate dehydrogenase
MPPGVVQFVPGIAEECGRVITESPHLAALHFTGSTATFNHLWRSISANIIKYIFRFADPPPPSKQNTQT